MFGMRADRLGCGTDTHPSRGIDRPEVDRTQRTSAEGLIDRRWIAIQGPLSRTSVVGQFGKGRNANAQRGRQVPWPSGLIVGR